MSSSDTAKRPARIARALPATTRYSDARGPRHVLLEERRRVRAGPRRARERDRVLHDVIGGRHAADQVLQLEDPLRRQHAAELRLVVAGLLADDLLLLALARVVDVHLEH